MLRGQQSYGTRSDISNDGPYACGRRLYSTLPEDSFDQQPLQRGPYRLVADVRLDNRPELASALGLPAARLGRLADADLLFECLLKWGADATEKLVGEFAFGLWNEADRTLLLARDLFGHRPLHFHRGSDFFAFTSMPSGLHALPRIPSQDDAVAGVVVDHVIVNLVAGSFAFVDAATLRGIQLAVIVDARVSDDVTDRFEPGI